MYMYTSGGMVAASGSGMWFIGWSEMYKGFYMLLYNWGCARAEIYAFDVMESWFYGCILKCCMERYKCTWNNEEILIYCILFAVIIAPVVWILTELSAVTKTIKKNCAMHGNYFENHFINSAIIKSNITVITVNTVKKKPIHNERALSETETSWMSAREIPSALAKRHKSLIADGLKYAEQISLFAESICSSRARSRRRRKNRRWGY